MKTLLYVILCIAYWMPIIMACMMCEGRIIIAYSEHLGGKSVFGRCDYWQAVDGSPLFCVSYVYSMFRV